MLGEGGRGVCVAVFESQAPAGSVSPPRSRGGMEPPACGSPGRVWETAAPPRSPPHFHGDPPRTTSLPGRGDWISRLGSRAPCGGGETAGHRADPGACPPRTGPPKLRRVEALSPVPREKAGLERRQLGARRGLGARLRRGESSLGPVGVASPTRLTEGCPSAPGSGSCGHSGLDSPAQGHDVSSSAWPPRHLNAFSMRRNNFFLRLQCGLVTTDPHSSQGLLSSSSAPVGEGRL